MQCLQDSGCTSHQVRHSVQVTVNISLDNARILGIGSFQSFAAMHGLFSIGASAIYNML